MPSFVDRLLASITGTNKGSPRTHTRTRRRVAIALAIALVGGSLGVMFHLTPSPVLHADAIQVAPGGVTNVGNGLAACGYSTTAGTSLQRVDFSESEVLRLIEATPNLQRVAIYYNDEHALALGVSKVTVNGVATDYTGNTVAYPGAPPAGGLFPVKTGAPYYTPAQLGDDQATVTPL